jgi:hypothetical protein
VYLPGQFDEARSVAVRLVDDDVVAAPSYQALRELVSGDGDARSRSTASGPDAESWSAGCVIGLTTGPEAMAGVPAHTRRPSPHLVKGRRSGLIGCSA